MEFRWNAWNVEHIARHGVDPEAAETVVEAARSPFPRRIEAGKWLVWGADADDRLLQVVFILDAAGTAFVIHARPLTRNERLRLRRWRR